MELVHEREYREATDHEMNPDIGKEYLEEIDLDLRIFKFNKMNSEEMPQDQEI